MTSSAQLKYLDAMGIPVWVSRDLVAVDKPVEQAPAQPATSSGAKDILQNLENQADVVAASAPQSSAPEAENKAASTSVDNNLDQNIQRQQAHHQQQKNNIAQTSSHIVYAEGDLEADWLVIGESPEIIVNHINQPYAGDLGVLLSNMIRAVGIKDPRKHAYLINSLKTSQTDNDDNINSEQAIAELNKILNDTIQKIKPKIILLVGQLAAQNILQTKEPLARLRAKAQKLPGSEIPVVVTYYPSYLLSKPQDKRKAWDDLKLAMSLVHELDS